MATIVAVLSLVLNACMGGDVLRVVRVVKNEIKNYSGNILALSRCFVPANIILFSADTVGLVRHRPNVHVGWNVVVVSLFRLGSAYLCRPVVLVNVARQMPRWSHTGHLARQPLFRQK
jgi:hypothetical protein